MNSGKSHKLFATLQLILAAGFIGFWAMYFAENPCPQKTIACERFLAFENSFPVPDLGYIVPMLVIGAVGLLKGQRYGVLASLLAGSALIFLGLLDVSFNLQNARYTINFVEGFLNVLINGVCLIFGPILIWNMWRRLEVTKS